MLSSFTFIHFEGLSNSFRPTPWNVQFVELFTLLLYLQWHTLLRTVSKQTTINLHSILLSDLNFRFDQILDLPSFCVIWISLLVKWPRLWKQSHKWARFSSITLTHESQWYRFYYFNTNTHLRLINLMSFQVLQILSHSQHKPVASVAIQRWQLSFKKFIGFHHCVGAVIIRKMT